MVSFSRRSPSSMYTCTAISSIRSTIENFQTLSGLLKAVDRIRLLTRRFHQFLTQSFLISNLQIGSYRRTPRLHIRSLYRWKFRFLKMNCQKNSFSNLRNKLLIQLHQSKKFTKQLRYLKMTLMCVLWLSQIFSLLKCPLTCSYQWKASLTREQVRFYSQRPLKISNREICGQNRFKKHK